MRYTLLPLLLLVLLLVVALVLLLQPAVSHAQGSLAHLPEHSCTYICHFVSLGSS
jgi:hypothetical protein